MRYLIASLVSPQTDQQLRQLYADTYHRPCTIKTLHLTFVPPFNLQGQSLKVNYPNLIQNQFAVEDQGIFANTRQILYLPLLPKEPLQDYYNLLLPQIRSQISFTASDFPKDTIPDFLPHITLDYNFSGSIIPFSNPININLEPVSLLTETAPGIWQPVS